MYASSHLVLITSRLYGAVFVKKEHMYVRLSPARRSFPVYCLANCTSFHVPVSTKFTVQTYGNERVFEICDLWETLLQHN